MFILPPEVEYIIDKLEKNNFEAYIVGGCVRDLILGKEPYDFDIATSALPMEVKKIFRRSIDTGIKHGTVTIIINTKHFEVTTFRIDGEYKDYRRPENVSFSRNLEEDLKRRDFTMNALAYSENQGVIDLFGGVNDIKAGIIRAVGEPKERFSEDALRMMRAVRFSCQLGFEIEGFTKDAIEKLAHLIDKVSKERIREELIKSVMGDFPNRLTLMGRLMDYVIPEFKKCLKTPQKHFAHIYNVGIHSLKAVENTRKIPVLRMAMLLHDIGKPETLKQNEKGQTIFHNHDKTGAEITKKILDRLLFDNKSKKIIYTLVLEHSKPISSVRKTASRLGDEVFRYLLEVKRADILAKNPDVIGSKLKELDFILEEYEEIKKNNDCLKIKDLKINGTDLKNMGLSEGPEIGIMLNEIFRKVLEKPEMNQKNILFNMVEEIQYSEITSILQFPQDTKRGCGKWSLEKFQMLLDKMGNPEKTVKLIHIAGTNGKGSTAKLISEILAEHGFKTGLYTSPHIEDFTERIRINNKPIGKKDFIRLVKSVLNFINTINNENTNLELDNETTKMFVIMTAVAFEYFRGCDFAVIETGMGGRSDITNVITPVLSIITSIGIDHTEYLGDTLEKIAFEKAGIIKQGAPVVLYPFQEEVVSLTIEKTAEEKNSDLILPPLSKVVNYNLKLKETEVEILSYGKLKIPLAGEHQIYNTLTAITALENLIPIKAELLKTAIEKTKWECRLEMVSEKPRIILDGAHNFSGISSLTAHISKFGKIICIIGMLKNKEYKKCISHMKKMSKTIIIVEIPHPLSLDFAAIEEEFSDIIKAKDIKSALDTALKNYSDEDIICVAGSLYLTAAFRKYLIQEGNL